MRALAFAAICVVSVNAAFAQPGSEPPPAGTPPAEPSAPAVDAAAAQPPWSPPVLPAPDVRNDAAWQLYHRAFQAVLGGKRRQAAELVTALQRDHAGHPAAQLSLRTGLGAAPGVVDQPAAPVDRQGAPVEQPSRAARAELALFQTIHGTVLGVELCILAECDSGEAFFGLALLGGIGGAGASLAVGELTSGQRALLNGGTFWGAANAGLLLATTQPDDDKTYTLTMMAGQLGGLGLGASLMSLRPTSGQVGLASSGGQWAFALSGLSVLAFAPDLDGQKFSGLLLVAMDLGIGVGAYLADRYPRVTRAQTFVIDAGGIVGAVGGAGLGVLVSGSADERATPGLAAAGAVIGLGAATYLTRNWGDTDDAGSVHAHLLPVARGRGALAGVSLDW